MLDELPGELIAIGLEFSTVKKAVRMSDGSDRSAFLYREALGSYSAGMFLVRAAGSGGLR